MKKFVMAATLVSFAFSGSMAVAGGGTETLPVEKKEEKVVKGSGGMIPLLAVIGAAALIASSSNRS